MNCSGVAPSAASGARALPVARVTRRRALSWLVSLACCALLALTALAAPVKLGDTLPDLSGFGLEGDMPDLKGKVVLLDFWASWCAPCKRSFPVMKELHEKYAARGFAVVAVSLDEQKSAMNAFLKKSAPPFTALHDAKGRLAEALGVEKMPTSFIIGSDGKVRAVHSGFDGESTRKEYLKQIEAALAASGK